MIGSQKQLAILLSKMAPFAQADISLEQYPTDSEVAAAVLWDAFMHHEIGDKRVADFGAGTGILGIGALALGARYVSFIELDSRVLPQLMANLHTLEEALGEEFSNYEIINGNVENYHNPVDVVLQNPPFGTQEKHADMVFVKKALTLAPLVYSFHKTSTEQYLISWAGSNGVSVANRYRFRFPLKQAMKQHTKRIQYIEVTCIKFFHELQ